MYSLRLRRLLPRMRTPYFDRKTYTQTRFRSAHVHSDVISDPDNVSMINKPRHHGQHRWYKAFILPISRLLHGRFWWGKKYLDSRRPLFNWNIGFKSCHCIIFMWTGWEPEAPALAYGGQWRKEVGQTCYFCRFLGFYSIFFDRVKSIWKLEYPNSSQI